MENSDPQLPEPDDASPDSARSRRGARWRIYGWSVIGLMAAVAVLNYLDLIEPDINRILLPLIVVAYVVYVIFRKR